jgi:hypothetical protein
MDTMAQFAILTLTTIFAAASAFAMAWAFLRGAFHLMQPATASRPKATSRNRSGSTRSDLVEGTRASAQKLLLHR